MSEPNQINKLYLQDGITVTPVDMALFAFNSGNAMEKSTYSIVERYINVTEAIEDFLSVYYFEGKDNYYEYHINLSQASTTLSGKDKFNNTLSGLTKTTPMIFVNGVKLNDGEYSINSDTSLTIFKQVGSIQYSSVIIHVCSGVDYMGRVTDSASWNPEKCSFTIQDVTLLRYAFFLNGKLINRSNIAFSSDGTVQFHIVYREGVDNLEYYRFSKNAINLIFDADPGFFSYGKKDKYNIEVPFVYDTLVTFKTHIARLAIDDLRTGFFIREEGTDGCLLIIDDDFEKMSIRCLKVSPFKKDTLETNEFYCQVPNARSIQYYVSNFDLNNKLLPELLGSFQGLLLNETYDSIERLRNLRSLTKVDSNNINELIEFLGFKLRLTDMNLEQKHALLEELNNFYKIVGTRASYNFYNIISKSSKIIDIQQLFTPIKDNSTVQDWLPFTSYTASKSTLVRYEGDTYYCTTTHVSTNNFQPEYWEKTKDTATEKRYVTFYTAEDLGAQYKRKYQFPYTDYGKIGQLANVTDILSNQPRSVGIPADNTRFLYCHCDNKYVPIITPNGEWNIYDNTSEGAKPIVRSITPNPYITDPKAGPNTPTIDRGRIADFEYKLDLHAGYTLIEGEDIFGEELNGLSSKETQIFIHGKKLLPTEYTILSPTSVLLPNKYIEKNLILLQARSFTPNNNEEGYEDYYYTDALNVENNDVYKEDGTTAYGTDGYSSYVLKYRLESDRTVFYHDVGTTQVTVGVGYRNGLRDIYVYTNNIAKPYSKVLSAYTGEVFTEQEIDVTDYSYTLTNKDAQLNGYIGNDTNVTLPNISTQEKTWYIDYEDLDGSITGTSSVLAYRVYDSKGKRIYDTNLNLPISGLVTLDKYGTTEDITFVSKDPVTGTVTVYGSCTRNIEADIKTEAAQQDTTVIIYKSSMTPTNIYDWGYVWETIKGEWIEWFEWDRPSNWYPTNHVDISLEIPAEMDYDIFVNEFKKTFYDIASTVLYIHSIINVYTFDYNKKGFGMMSAPTYQTREYTLTNNPQIQPPVAI